MSNFISDYLLYNSGNECPENYHIWSGLSILSATINRKLWIDMGYFEIIPNLYVCLVGEQGNRKTVAKDIAYDMFREVCPNIPVAAESMSKEAITQFMALEEQARSFKDCSTQKIIETHPFSIFITELKNFLSINPITMVDFLTTIYDRKFYDVKTKNKGTDIITNPCITFLACETPEWLIARLKDSIISGGFCRRMLFIVESDRDLRIAFPTISTEAAQAAIRCKDHLRILNANDFAGQIVWSPEAKKFYQEWYAGIKLPADPFMKGFYRSKHVQSLKVATLCLAADYEASKKLPLVMSVEALQAGIGLVDRMEINLPKLTQSVGRNELAYHTQRLLEIIQGNGGIMREKELQRVTYKDFKGEEFHPTINHLVQTDQAKRGRIGDIVWIGLPATFDELKKKIEAQSKNGGDSSSAPPSPSPGV
jgi:hypothetical protein